MRVRDWEGVLPTTVTEKTRVLFVSVNEGFLKQNNKLDISNVRMICEDNIHV